MKREIKEVGNYIKIGRLIINDKDIFKNIMSSNDELNINQLTVSIPNVLEKYEYYAELMIREDKLIINNKIEEIVIQLSKIGNDGNISSALTSFLDNKRKVDKIIQDIVNNNQNVVFYLEIYNYLKGYNGLPKKWVGMNIAYNYVTNQLRLRGINIIS